MEKVIIEIESNKGDLLGKVTNIFGMFQNSKCNNVSGMEGELNFTEFVYSKCNKVSGMEGS